MKRLVTAAPPVPTSAAKGGSWEGDGGRKLVGQDMRNPLQEIGPAWALGEAG